jgi:hypothetical protein
MGLFAPKEDKKKRAEAAKGELPVDELLRGELTELSMAGDRREFSRADTEVREVVSRATKADIRNIMLIDQGRCPSCHARTENFLFTRVCPSCGWFRREVPGKGKSRVYLKNGEEIACDYVFRGGNDEFLLIREGVVVSEVMRSSVWKVDHVWEANDLQEARALAKKLREGLCSWCERSLAETTDEEGVYEDYVAFGALQERYLFCSEKCQRAFRRQYASRVHRNCYETDCNLCNLCIKRYDTHGFKRNILK